MKHYKNLFSVMTDALGACRSFLLLQYVCNKLLVLDRYRGLKGFGYYDSGNESHLENKSF